MDAKVSSAGGTKCLYPSSPSTSAPQHNAEPSARNPQAYEEPVNIDVKVSYVGGDSRPYPTAPQHTAVPLARNPQVRVPPALMDVKVSSAGGVD